MLTRTISSRDRPSSFWAICTMSPSYVKLLEHSRPNVHLTFLAHLFTRRACIEPGALAWHDIPTRARFDSPIWAAFTIASGLAEYVYRDPAAASTPWRSVTT